MVISVKWKSVVKIRLMLVLLIFLGDMIFFYLFKSSWVDGADHSSLFHVFIFQFLAITDIVLNFKLSRFCLSSLGLYKQYREYIVVMLLLLFSYLSFHTAIIGTDQWGKECTYPSCIENAEKINLKVS